MARKTAIAVMLAAALAATLGACGRRGALESPSEAAKPAEATPTPTPTPAQAP